MRSSQEAMDLIVAEEVTDEKTYKAIYQKPEWPGLQSGITVGIGYDLGYSDKAQIASDWSDYLPPATVVAMQRFAGLKGSAARDALTAARGSIVVPWGAAVSVFRNVVMPRWEATVLRAVPGSENLTPGCFGVLVSIAYNRGASFSLAGDRYIEMRNIKRLVASEEYKQIPAQIRSMKRLWQNNSKAKGLLLRREREARLFEKSIEPVPQVTLPSNSSLPAILKPRTKYSAETELLQTKLVGMKYHEVGNVDGKWGGKTLGAVTMFMNDREKSADGLMNDAGFTSDAAKSVVLDEISAAISEQWERPVAEARKNATAKDIAAEVPSVDATWYQKLWGYVLGVPSFLIAGFKYLFGDQNDPTSYVTTIKDFFAAIPTELYALAVGGLAVAIILAAVRAQRATVKAYQEGKIN